jgi:hypothetical protein
MIPPSARMMSPPTLYVGERLRKRRFLMTDNIQRNNGREHFE